MKKSTFLKCRISILLLFLPLFTFAQDEPSWIVVTTGHWDMSKEDGSDEEWMAMAKEYHQKVTMKNELIMRSAFLVHYFTEDNSEVRMVSAYKNWEDIDKAQTRTDELIDAGWPDSVARDAFFDKFDSYMVNVHSDEIYRAVPGLVKPITTQSTEETVVFIQNRQRAYPEDGTGAEFNALHKEYIENTAHKNPFVIGFFNYRHGWGSDNRDFIEVRVYENWSAIEQAFDKQEELMKAHWPDETARNAFMDKYNKYFTGLHADYIFHGLPELRK